MSFILDALKKSESERQRQQAVEFSSVPSGSQHTPAPRWLWALGILLVVNLVVVAGLVLRPDAEDSSLSARERLAESAPDGPGETAAGRDEDFSTRIAEARRKQPPPAHTGQASAGSDSATAPLPGSALPASPLPASSPPSSARPTSTAARGFATLPSLEELQLDGALDLPPLHIDLHVYNEAAERRFVSINMNKYRENERMREGPLVQRITREGVVLEYQGKTFTMIQ